MAEERHLQDRLDTFQKKRPSARPRLVGIRLLALLLGLGGAGVAYWLATKEHGVSGLETSAVEPFQDGKPTGGRLEFPAQDVEQAVDDALTAVEDALDVPEPNPTEPSREVLDELARLREALAASQNARNAEIKAAVGDLRHAFQAQLKNLQDEVDARNLQLEDAKRENAARLESLQSLLDVEQARRAALEAELQNNALVADQRLLEERQRQEAEQKRREAERAAADLLRAQIRSPALVFSGGSSGAASSVAGSSNTAATTIPVTAPPLDDNETYLRKAAQPLVVETAARMAFPKRTLAQGSVIQATLQTAINSDLPGNVIAVVSEPVPAFAGDRILIPRGSRLFGQYRSGIKLNQKRILILWTRVLTPNGTSFDITSVAGDPLGRSGLTGLVDTKFLERFGGAALISIIGAAPSVAAAQTQNKIASETLKDIGSGLSEATDSVIAERLSTAPTIYVDQGASVTVLVDRDVVIH